jgi:hypothetical protein
MPLCKSCYRKSFYDNIIVNVIKTTRSIVVNNKKDPLGLCDNLIVNPRILNIHKHATDCHFRDHKWGPAKTSEDWRRIS